MLQAVLEGQIAEDAIEAVVTIPGASFFDEAPNPFKAVEIDGFVAKEIWR
jgi:hypothetical protein